MGAAPWLGDKHRLETRWDVFKKAIERWRLFKGIEVGHRFQTRYNNHRRRHERGETSRHRRLFNIVGGPVLIVAGLVFLPTPGPSYIIIVVGMWMLAGELLSLARLFDRVEVRLRNLGQWIKERWNVSPTSVKVVVILACAVALGYGIYYLVSGG